MPENNTLDQIKLELAKVLTEDPTNDSEIMRLTKAIQQHAADVKKAEAEKLKQEAEALAGQREDLEAEIYAALKKVIDPAKLLAVKAKGFTIVVDHLENDKGQLDPKGEVKVTGACKLTVPTIKTRTSTGGGGGGGTGVTVEMQTGMKRGDLIEKYATDEEKAAIKAKGDEAEAKGTNRNSAEWSAGKPVVKRILADHPELIKK